MEWLVGACLLALLPVVALGVSIYVTGVYVAWAVVWPRMRGQALPAHPIRAFIVEWFCVIAVVILGARAVGRRLRRLHDGRAGGTPVLCVHGYTQNVGNFTLLGPRLGAGGAGPVYGVNMKGRFVDLNEWARQIVQALEKVRAETGAVRVDVVCHSMGGLATRLALARHGADALVRRVVTLGSPHRGTLLAPLGLGVNATQMRIGGPFLSALPEAPASLTSIWSTCDGMVLPVDNAVCGGHNVRFDDLGHLSLLFSPRVAAACLAALTAPDVTAQVTASPSASLVAAG